MVGVGVQVVADHVGAVADRARVHFVIILLNDILEPNPNHDRIDQITNPQFNLLLLQNRPGGNHKTR